MGIKTFDFSIERKEFSELKKETIEFMKILQNHLKKNKIDADVFLGGSFAKGTITKSEEYDADIFVRFDWKYEEISRILEKILNGIKKEHRPKMKKMHGSRDYFRIVRSRKLTFEVIPVTRIKKVKEARNVTDQSFFHVKYVKKHLKGSMIKEIANAKKFFKAQKFYGAESYIRGFSGYGLECLIIHFKTFEKLLKELSKIPKGERIVIDPARHYKKKNDVLFELNESKTVGPIILVDPTWKERNVLAALSRDTFEKFQEVSRKFLRNPSEKFFEISEIDEPRLEKLAEKKKAEFMKLSIETNRQEGDIAGTKLRKFFLFLIKEMKKYFEVLDQEFSYPGDGQTASAYLVFKKKDFFVKLGPPIKMKKAVLEFKKVNKKTIVKDGFVCSKRKFDFSGRQFMEDYTKMKESRRKMNDMGIVRLNVE